jgi:hypothetical protein
MATDRQIAAKRRREFIVLLGSGVTGWPLAARAQQPAMPVIGLLDTGSVDSNSQFVRPFREGLGQVGYFEGQNVAIEYRWAEGLYERLPRAVGGCSTDTIRLVRPGMWTHRGPAAPG